MKHKGFLESIRGRGKKEKEGLTWQRRKTHKLVIGGMRVEEVIGREGWEEGRGTEEKREGKRVEAREKKEKREGRRDEGRIEKG